MWREIGAGFLDLLFPPVCSVCDEPGEAFCDACRTQIREVPPDAEPIEGLEVASLGLHEGPLRTAVLQLKFGRRTRLARPLGELLGALLETRGERWIPDALVPVPMHWTRRLERGFNQSELLASWAGRTAGIPVARALRRVRRTRPQVGLSGAERRRNLRDAFRAAPGGRLAGLRLVLVDDVCTTGTTLRLCAATLRRAGAAEVFALTCSREL